MDIRRVTIRSISICFLVLFAASLEVVLAACSPLNQTPNSTPVLDIPAPTQMTPTSIMTETVIPLIETPTTTCSDNLVFIKDVTIPDNTIVAPNGKLDKQWLVQNSGNCNWDARYRVRLISGDALGASTEQALYPARAGTQANLRILFQAPQEAGVYVSEWQAFDANGIQFGDSFFMKIIVE
jgi:hypothetical protein